MLSDVMGCLVTVMSTSATDQTISQNRPLLLKSMPQELGHCGGNLTLVFGIKAGLLPYTYSILDMKRVVPVSLV